MIGLGIKQGDLTKSAEAAIESADEIIARTSHCASFANLQGFEVRTLDYIFEKSRNFDTLNKNLAKEVLKAGREARVCYCVDGAVSEDEACKIILSRKKAEICEGVSHVSYILNAAGMKGIKGIQGGPVTSLSAYSVRALRSCRAAVIYDIDDFFAATEVKSVLSDLFGEESDCVFLRGDKAEKIKVFEIDRQKKYDMTCAVAIEEKPFLEKERYDFADLVHMTELLRAPGGCPWDRAQTCESIKQNAIEEAYELADAIERGDDGAILEETGDVLLQAAFHAVIKNEQGVFNATDATTGVVKKLIFRHSHIFGKDKAKDENEALGVWEKNKATEKNQTTFGESVMAVPKNMPACMRAQKVGKRAGKSGMDFLSPVSASEKLWEEVTEMVEAMKAGDKDATFEEAGDVLFAAVNCCRLAGVDCEEALSCAVTKFSKRFVECEKMITADGKYIGDLDEMELDYYWTRAKNAT